MYTLKINIVSFLSSWASWTRFSTKSISNPPTNDNNKRPSKEKISNEPSAENNLSSQPKENAIYYLPIHLM